MRKSLNLLIGCLLVFTAGLGLGSALMPNSELQDRATVQDLVDSPWPGFHANLNHTGVSPYDTSHVFGSVIWSFETGDTIRSNPTIDSDGTIYFGSNDHHLYAVYPNGTLKWSFTTGDFVSSSPAIDADGTIYFGAWDFNVYALYPNGTLKWSFPTNDIIVSSPSIGTDGTIYIGSEDYYVYALNPDGTLKWSYLTGSCVKAVPAIADDGTVYVGSYDRNMYAFTPNGTLKWFFHTAVYIISSAAIGGDGTIYFGSWDNIFYALNPDGTLRWSYATGSYILSSPAIGSDGAIYFGSYDNRVYALNPNGTLRWSYLTGGYIFSSPAIGAEGTVYIGSCDNSLYALNPNGTLRWSYATGGWIESSPSISGDGTVYVGSYDYKVYAFNNAPPVASFSVDQPSGNTSELFAFNPAGCSDAEDQIGSLLMRWDWESDGSWDTGWTAPREVTHSFASNGTYAVSLEVQDSGGLTNLTKRTVLVEDVAPETSVSISGILGSNNWFTSDVVVWLNATDAGGSGLNGTYRNLDGSGWEISAGEMVISTWGVHTIEFYSEDNAGNEEDVRQVEVKIDESPPILEFEQAQNVSFPSGGTAKITWNASDQVSGIDHYELSVDGKPFQLIESNTITLTGLPAGKHFIIVRAIDDAGHVSEKRIDFTVTSDDGVSGESLILLLLILAATVSVPAYYLHLNRRKKERDDEPGDEPAPPRL